MEADGVSPETFETADGRWRDSERGLMGPLTTLDVGLCPRLYVSVVRARLIRDERLKRSIDGSRLRSRLGVRL